MTETPSSYIWQDPSVFFQMVRKPGKRITILIHINPDGDAIGSGLGLMRILRNAGHTGTVISPNAYPEFLKWLPGTEDIIVFDDDVENATVIQNSDIIIAVDFNTLRRIKQFNDIVSGSKAYILMIDHHPNPEAFAHCIISDVSASSSAEIVLRFIKSGYLSQYMDTETAVCLFTGIITDTGCFSYNSSERSTYEAVAELLDYGIDKDKIYSLLYDDFSADRMRLLGYALNNKMTVMPEYHTAFIWLTREELKRYNFQVGDSEGFVNYPLSIRGVWFSAFFVEKEDHIKISFRSKGAFKVNQFAEKYFNGGGHVNASGGESYETMENTLQHFKEMILLNKDDLGNNEI